MQLDVLGAVGPHVDDLRPVRRRARTRRGAQPGEVLDRQQVQRRRPAPARRRRGRAASRRASRSDRSRSRPGGSRRSRRRRCRRARSSAARRSGVAVSSEPASCASATSPVSSTTGPGLAGGDAVGGRECAVDAVRAAVGEDAQRRVAHREDRLDVADRHRRGDDQRGLRRQPGAELERDARLAQILAQRPRRSPTPRARRRPRHADAHAGSGSGSTVSASASSSARGLARRASGRRCARGPASVVGVDEHLHGVEPREPLAQRLRRRQVADAQDRARAGRLRERRDAQQRVVVGDRAGAAARARERVGEQRPAGALAQRGRRARELAELAGGASPVARCGRARRRRAARPRRAARASRRRSARPRRAGDARPRAARRGVPPPPGSSAGSGSSSTSGSRSGRFRWTGPGRAPACGPDRAAGERADPAQGLRRRVVRRRPR